MQNDTYKYTTLIIESQLFASMKVSFKHFFLRYSVLSSFMARSTRCLVTSAGAKEPLKGASNASIFFVPRVLPLASNSGFQHPYFLVGLDAFDQFLEADR